MESMYYKRLKLGSEKRLRNIFEENIMEIEELENKKNK